MKLLCCFIISALYILPALSSMKCSDEQYPWPYEKPQLCCDMCPPGYFLDQRSRTNCEHVCKPCGHNKFTDGYNAAMSCSFCKSCNNPNMEVKTKCNATHDTVCDCKAGYKCKNNDCKECVVISTTAKPTVPPTTTKPTVPPTTTKPTVPPTTAKPTVPPTTTKPTVPPSITGVPLVTTPGAVPTQLATKQIGDTVWFLVIIALLCTGILLFFLTQIKPFLLWIKSKHGYFLAENPALQPPCAGLEVVSKPVQEMSGKCEICN